jgi:hypothetical protein
MQGIQVTYQSILSKYSTAAAVAAKYILIEKNKAGDETR